jgi:predicted DNA-binding transcriptional regulator YafY
MLSSHFGLNKSERKVMGYDSNIDYAGYDKILPLFNAIINKRVLEICYEPFNKSKENIVFHPYYLKQYNNRWFILGLHQEFNVLTWNLALDRILTIKEVTGNYIDSNIDWEEHFYDIIGVTKPNNVQPEVIELLFSKEQANYINTKPLHPSQKAKFLDTGELFVQLKLIPNYEFEMLILSFGEKVKVLKPISIKERIIFRIGQTQKNYI